MLRSASSQWWRSMAIAVIFGLAFATLLTLVVVPTLYVTVCRLGQRLSREGREQPGAEETTGASPTEAPAEST